MRIKNTIDSQAYPPDEDDIEYLGDICREIREYLIVSGTFPWNKTTKFE